MASPYDVGNIFAPAQLPTIVMVKRYLKWAGLLVAAVLAVNAAAEESHVRARLVADAAVIEPGQLFLLGVELEPDPGWHVYWRNPGEAGLVVWLKWNSTPGSIEFFPDPGPGLKVEGPRVQTRGSLTRIDFTISRLKTTDSPAETLGALIVTRDADGNRRATVSHIAID